MVRGGHRLHEVLNGGGGGGDGAGDGAGYRNKQEVAELAWFLLYKAVAKGSAFISGAWIIEDAGYALFDALSPLCYSRKMYGGSPLLATDQHFLVYY